MDGKTTAFVSYLTLIGWIIAIISYSNSAEKSSLARFHIKQSLGLFLTAVALNILVSFIPGVVYLAWIVYIALIILWIIGFMAALNQKEQPIPLVGEFFDKNLNFVK